MRSWGCGGDDLGHSAQRPPPYSAAVYAPFWAMTQELVMLRSLHLRTGGRKAGRQDLNNPLRIYVGSRDTE
jgi:hypothetical protein